MYDSVGEEQACTVRIHKSTVGLCYSVCPHKVLSLHPIHIRTIRQQNNNNTMLLRTSAEYDPFNMG